MSKCHLLYTWQLRYPLQLGLGLQLLCNISGLLWQLPPSVWGKRHVHPPNPPTDGHIPTSQPSPLQLGFLAFHVHTSFRPHLTNLPPIQLGFLWLWSCGTTPQFLRHVSHGDHTLLSSHMSPSLGTLGCTMAVQSFRHRHIQLWKPRVVFCYRSEAEILTSGEPDRAAPGHFSSSGYRILLLLMEDKRSEVPTP